MTNDEIFDATRGKEGSYVIHPDDNHGIAARKMG